MEGTENESEEHDELLSYPEDSFDVLDALLYRYPKYTTKVNECAGTYFHS